MRAGIPYAHALDLPHGELLDLIAVQRIEERGFSAATSEDEDEFWEIMEMR